MAILKVNWDALGKDYIENFVPFVAQSILSLKPHIVSALDVQRKTEDDFGLRIPQNSLRSILGRVAKRGYIKREGQVYVPNYDALGNLNFEATRQRVLREHNATIEKLIKFVGLRYRVSWRTEEAETALLSYIAEHEVELLRSSVDGKPIPQVESPPKSAYFFISAFIRHLCENDPDGFRYLDTIVKGNMLANVLLFPDMSQVQRRFRRTAVYCDTAFLLRALGFEGPARQAPCKELLDLLYEVGADLRCFHRTRDEIHNVLYAFSAMLRSREPLAPYGPTFRYLSDAGFQASDVELELATLDKKLAALRIEVRDKPEYVGTYQIDEKALEEALEAEIKYGEERQRARVHDVDCLSAIYRLRKGQDYYHIEDCVALFLTTNTTLSRVAWQFFKKRISATDGAVSIALTDHLLTTILWLKKPMSAPDLPRKHIIADSYAAMEPGDRLWQKYLTEISKLEKRGDISSDEYYLLRSSLQARAELMDLTLGDEGALVEGTPQEIIERVKQSIRAEELAKLAEERRLRQEVERELQLVKTEESTELSKERRLRQEVERELQLIKARQRAREEDRNLRIEGFSRKLASWLSTATFAILVVLLLLGTYASFPHSLPHVLSHWLSYLLPMGQIMLVLLALLNLLSGTTIRGYLRRFEVFLARYIEIRLKGLVSTLAAYLWPASH